MPRGNQTIPVRGNPSIWRVAKWLWITFSSQVMWRTWDEATNRDHYYDKAAELMKKLQLNEFTGEDTHKD